MAGTPALRKVIEALETTLASAGTVFIDRPEDESFGEGQLPAWNILTDAEVEFSPLDQGTTLHRATVDIDLIDKIGETSIASRLDELEAETVELLHADRTLGGLAQDVRPDSSAASGQIYADAGARTLSVTILYLTPLGDHRTVIGATGIIP